MRISHKHKFIYFSIPKTASEALRAALKTYSDEEIVTFPRTSRRQPFYSHMTPDEAERAFQRLRKPYDAYYRFATVRNPWARAASLYRMAVRDKTVRLTAPFGEWLARMDEYRERYADYDMKWWPYGMISMSTFLYAGADGLRPERVNRAFRIEDQLDALCAELGERAGVKLSIEDIKPVNRAPEQYDWREMYGPDEIRRVAELYRDDIERFGYAFDAAPNG